MAEIRAGNVFVCAAEDGCGLEIEVRRVRASVDESVLSCCGKPMARKEFSGWSADGAGVIARRASG